MKPSKSSRRVWAFTLVELLVGIAVLVTLLAIAVPSLQQLIALQRVKSVTAELVTSLQYARTEAVARNYTIRVAFQSSISPPMTCYVIYMQTTISDCDCSRTPGNACAAGTGTELRTIQVPSSTGVQLLKTSTIPGQLQIGADALRAGNTSDYIVETSRINGSPGLLRTTVNASARPSVCSPDGSISGAAAC